MGRIHALRLEAGGYVYLENSIPLNPEKRVKGDRCYLGFEDEYDSFVPNNAYITKKIQGNPWIFFIS